MRVAGFDAVELTGGLIVFAGGCAVAIGATGYQVGELTRMGPGYFPLAVGIVLALLGLGLIVGSRCATLSLPAFRLRPVLAIFAGLVFFGLTIERFGLVPSILGLVILTSLAQDRPSLLMIAATAAFLIVFSVGIFIYALAIPIPAIRW